uniref:Uncharacterized protein n=1 Tax=Pyxicephalus adspersus TaxID=30357 RepID=A0AAV3A5U2_PYXAD|nr:TPA: hypothetical protein GDO54_014750 [Pyxicephalus adspersus]
MSAWERPSWGPATSRPSGEGPPTIRRPSGGPRPQHRTFLLAGRSAVLLSAVFRVFLGAPLNPGSRILQRIQLHLGQDGPWQIHVAFLGQFQQIY